MILLYALKDILAPICKLLSKLQYKHASLCDFPDYLQTALKQLDDIVTRKEYIASANDFFKECGFFDR